ncbi:hypothetical protein HPB49_015219 [Dermacentor silvarum]|uniref:Uncharacterized protein n=1 Tax=Dermacentor silvarum TaxID=543639 RepID=A0ACB8D6G4_DERSI|nr:hypothetical protein HPB49_015219 [Dermacentor silvarum]
MIRKLGKPTLFQTLSMHELHDERLPKGIKSLKDTINVHCHAFGDIHTFYHEEIASNDHVVSALYFHRQIVHAHVLIWLDETPEEVLGDDMAWPVATTHSLMRLDTDLFKRQ